MGVQSATNGAQARKRPARASAAAWPADRVVRLPVAALAPYARNARMHSDTQVDQIAAEIEARSALCLDVDRGYCDVAVERWQAFAGEKATLEGDGRSFEEVAAERSRTAA